MAFSFLAKAKAGTNKFRFGFPKDHPFLVLSDIYFFLTETKIQFLSSIPTEIRKICAIALDYQEI